jgi:hypothetical protein
LNDLLLLRYLVADITNLVVVNFSDRRVRSVADKLAALHYVIEAWLADYASQGISAALTAGGATNLVAQSAGDARVPITGNQIINLRAALLQMQTALDVTAVSGVGASVFSIVNAIQVSGSPQSVDIRAR